MGLTPLTNPEDFPAAEKSTYLNAASAALMYQRAATRILAWQRDLAENGTLNFDERAEEEIFHGLHAAAAELFNCNPADIAGGSSATELLSSLAWAMLPSKGQSIIGTDAAHPSTVYPWQRVARQVGANFQMARADQRGYVDPDELLSMVDEQTAAVVISHVEYRSGQRYDLQALGAKAHRNGAHLVVDATQSAGQVPIDVQEMNVDVFVSSGYKWLCGPFGAAVMYLAPHLQAELDPGLVGWRCHKEMWEFRADRLEFLNTAARFEASTMAYGCALGLAESVKYLASIGADQILAHNMQLSDLLRVELIERGARILSPSKERERSSILSVDFPKQDTRRIAERLNRENVILSYRMGAIRISPHLYNDEDDVDRVITILDSILS